VIDSSLFISGERGKFDLAGFLAAHPHDQVFIAAITASELLHGCARATDAVVRARRVSFVESVLQIYAMLPFGLAEAREHAKVWAELESRGQIIGERDLQIAATAIANGHAVATLNRKEFERVPGVILVQSPSVASGNPIKPVASGQRGGQA
jgi:tRNA(fMet)-specific endonuclease VapC